MMPIPSSGLPWVVQSRPRSRKPLRLISTKRTSKANMRSRPTRLVKSITCGKRLASSATLSRSASERPSPSMTMLSPMLRVWTLGMSARKACRSRAMRAVSCWRTVILMRWLRPLRVHTCSIVSPGPLAISRISRSSSTAADITLPSPTARRPALRCASTRVSPANIWISVNAGRSLETVVAALGACGGGAAWAASTVVMSSSAGRRRCGSRRDMGRGLGRVGGRSGIR